MKGYSLSRLPTVMYHVENAIFALILNTRTNAIARTEEARKQGKAAVPDDAGCNHAEEAMCP